MCINNKRIFASFAKITRVILCDVHGTFKIRLDAVDLLRIA